MYPQYLCELLFCLLQNTKFKATLSAQREFVQQETPLIAFQRGYDFLTFLPPDQTFSPEVTEPPKQRDATGPAAAPRLPMMGNDEGPGSTSDNAEVRQHTMHEQYNRNNSCSIDG